MYTYTNRAGAEMIIDEKRQVEFNGITYTTWHGSPFDRGSADSYYGRAQVPHWWPEGTGKGVRIASQDMTLAQMREYYRGYEYNEQHGDKKEW
jgi:hypothetical protein